MYAILTLGELLATTRLAQTDLLTLDFARIASNQTSLLQHRLERGIVVNQRTSDAMAHGTRLTGLTAAGDVHHDVELAQCLSQIQWLTNDHPARLTGKEHV